MRIVHTSLRYPPATGGAENYVRDIVEHTRSVEGGRDVRVLTSKMRTHGPISELKPELLLDDPPYVQRLHHIKTPLVSYPRLQALSHYLGHHKPDVIHGHGFWYQPADTAARYARKHNIPFIFHPIYYENAIRKKAMWQLYARTIGHQTFATADVVVTISPYEEQLIRDAGYPVNRFECIPPGIDVERFSAKSTDNPFETRGITGSILLSASRIAEGKGIQDVIAALPAVIREVPDTHYVIVGEDFGYAKTLKKQAVSLGIQDHVHSIGKLSDDDLVAAYQYADIFVHPSHYEAFGIVLAEALAAKTPVVARNATAIPFVAPHEVAGLLFKDRAELESHLITLLKDKKQRELFGQQGYEHVVDAFGWDKIENRVLALYETLG